MRLRASHHYPSRRSVVLADNMVSTSQPLAAQAGLSMITRGGNAADAAIATAIALTVVEPTGNGVGSDAFAILWDGKQLHGLNASGRAPKAWSLERFAARDEMPMHGWNSVTVPGAVSAWVEISRKFGSLPFEMLFEPAIGYAERGFPVSPKIAQLWARGGNILADQPGFAEVFLQNGKAPLPGGRFTNPALAHSLRLIAETKGKAFYEGEIADALIAHSNAHGGAMTSQDLADQCADWCGTISRKFGDATLHEIPPNGQGIAALMGLGILHHTNICDLEADDPLAMHLQIEAMKLALADTEKFVGDIKHMTTVSPEDMLEDGYLAERARLIDPARAQDFGAGAPKHGGTVYLSTADSSGMMVSYIQSNYAGFGSGVAVPITGIHLQNRGWGFSLDPKSANVVGSRKRPFHTIIPGFLMGKTEPLMSLGVMGGPMQAQGHLQMVLRTQLWGQDPQMAVDAPRWRITEGLGLACETTLPSQTLENLAYLGHSLAMEEPDTAFGFGGAQLIHRLTDGGYAGGSDPRKDGATVGL